MKTLGLPLRPPASLPDSEDVYSEEVAEGRHIADSLSERPAPLWPAAAGQRTPR